MLFLIECPKAKKIRLNRHNKRNALNISGDLVLPLSPIFL
jgi:hypothetical protein